MIDRRLLNCQIRAGPPKMANKSQFSIVVSLSLGEYLKLCLDRAGMTVATLAKRTGVSTRTIYRCLADEASLDYSHFLEVCKILAIEPSVIRNSFVDPIP
jgi:DNA-binding XRE family transcriptional regulator